MAAQCSHLQCRPCLLVHTRRAHAWTSVEKICTHHVLGGSVEVNRRAVALHIGDLPQTCDKLRYCEAVIAELGSFDRHCVRCRHRHHEALHALPPVMLPMLACFTGVMAPSLVGAVHGCRAAVYTVQLQYRLLVFRRVFFSSSSTAQ